MLSEHGWDFVGHEQNVFLANVRCPTVICSRDQRGLGLNLELLRTGPGSGKELAGGALELKDSGIQVQCSALLPPVVKCTLLVLNFVGL